MINSKEALNNLNKLVAKTNSLGNCWDIEVLEQLVDKDTGKKPIKVHMIGITNYGVCPVCQNAVSEDVFGQYSYCEKCGQKIDWFEVDE